MSVQFYLCSYCCCLALPILGWQPVWQVVGASYRPLMCFPSPHLCSLQWHRAPSSWTWRAYGHSDGIGFPWLGPMRWHRTVFTLDSSPRTQLPHREEAKEPCGRPLSRLQLQLHLGCSDHHIPDTAGLQGFQPSLWVPTDWWLILGGNRDKCPCGQMKVIIVFGVVCYEETDAFPRLCKLALELWHVSHMMKWRSVSCRLWTERTSMTLLKRWGLLYYLTTVIKGMGETMEELDCSKWVSRR